MTKHDRRNSLRQSTSNAHAALDNAVGAFKSLDDYKRYVLAIAKFRLPLEQQLALTSWPDSFGSWRPGFIGDALQTDIDDLQLQLPAAGVPTRHELDTAELLGIAYVLEGSMLGAQILYQRARDIGLSDRFGARHLAKQSGGIQNWRNYLVLLEQDGTVAFDAVVSAANATFAAALDAFTWAQSTQAA